MDDAEAKQRGVPIEVVQLEHAKATIAELQKENSALKAQVAKLNAAVVELQKNQRKVTTTTPADYQLKNGMTLAQAEAAMPGEWAMTDESNGVQHYVCRWEVPDYAADMANEQRTVSRLSGGGHITGAGGAYSIPWTKTSVADIDVEAGKVINYSIEAEAIKNWKRVGGGPPDEVERRNAESAKNGVKARQ
ncbi:MAG TPA: hypothetical protein VHI52_08110 [Verrucomicrobiae bacterium]|nr:hypothetical protein [Verrucomicrobiae bacterium]